jgi:hypothetical protein
MIIAVQLILEFAGQVLQTAATNAGRLVMTRPDAERQRRGSSIQERELRQPDGDVQLRQQPLRDVESFSSFSNVSLPAVTNANGTVNSGAVGYSPGQSRRHRRRAADLPVADHRVGPRRPAVSSANSTNTLVATVAFATNLMHRRHDKIAAFPAR